MSPIREAGMPPETEASHFRAIFSVHARRLGMEAAVLQNAYQSGELHVPNWTSTLSTTGQCARYGNLQV